LTADPASRARLFSILTREIHTNLHRFDSPQGQPDERVSQNNDRYHTLLAPPHSSLTYTPTVSYCLSLAREYGYVPTNSRVHHRWSRPAPTIAGCWLSPADLRTLRHACSSAVLRAELPMADVAQSTGETIGQVGLMMDPFSRDHAVRHRQQEQRERREAVARDKKELARVCLLDPLCDATSRL
jgi:hypothetical protein